MQPPLRTKDADFFQFVGELIRVPFSIECLLECQRQSSALRGDERTLVSLILEAKQGFSPALKGRVAKLPMTPTFVFSPLISLAAFLQGKVKTEEQEMVVRNCFQLLLTKGKQVPIRMILQDPVPLQLRLKITERLLTFLAYFPNIAHLHGEIDSSGLKELYHLWNQYPRWWSLHYQKPFDIGLQDPFALHFYFAAFLQLHHVGIASREDCETFRIQLKHYTQTFPNLPFPREGYADGWSVRLSALQEMAKVYMVGFEIELWDGKTRIDEVFPCFAEQLRTAVFDCATYQDPAYSFAEWFFWDDFLDLDQFFEKAMPVVPLVIKEAVLVLNAFYQLTQPIAKSSRPLFAFIGALEHGLIEWREHPEMHTLHGQVLQRLQMLFTDVKESPPQPEASSDLGDFTCSGKRKAVQEGGD